MSYGHADPADLVATAREALLASVLPALRGEGRYDALMISNALAVACRALHADPRRSMDEVSRLFALVGGFHPADRDPRLQLGAAIRRGDFDLQMTSGQGPDAKLAAHLRTSVLDRLSIDNPKLLP